MSVEVTELTTVEKHRRRLEALNGVAMILSRRAGQRETLTDVLDLLEARLDMSRGTVMLLSADGTELSVGATRGPTDNVQSDVRYQRGEGITGRVLQTGESAIVPRIADEPRFQDRLHGRGREAQHEELGFICVPILLERDVVGTLSVDVAGEDESGLAACERVLRIVASMIASDVGARRVALMERRRLESENRRLRNALGESFRPESIIGNSRVMHEVYERIEQVAASDTTVLVRGESGTGKELVASAVHYGSARARGPFVKVNCAQLSENLLESELFGHEKGSFTGAMARRIGRIEEARGGTIFFDEIGDFSPAVQIKLLRILQEREFQRVGSNETIRADVRVIAATNVDLERAVAEGRFRQDLFYRIHVFPVYLPPLRERKDDIPHLTDHFIEKYAKHMGKDAHRISTNAINMMLAYHWPGNVRELENAIEYAVLTCREGVIHGHNLPPTLQMPGPTDMAAPGSLKARVQILEKDVITDALKHTGGNVAAASRELGITARMVRYKMKNLGIEPMRRRRGDS